MKKPPCGGQFIRNNKRRRSCDLRRRKPFPSAGMGMQNRNGSNVLFWGQNPTCYRYTTILYWRGCPRRYWSFVSLTLTSAMRMIPIAIPANRAITAHHHGIMQSPFLLVRDRVLPISVRPNHVVTDQRLDGDGVKMDFNGFIDGVDKLQRRFSKHCL